MADSSSQNSDTSASENQNFQGFGSSQPCKMPCPPQPQSPQLPSNYQSLVHNLAQQIAFHSVRGYSQQIAFNSPGGYPHQIAFNSLGGYPPQIPLNAPCGSSFSQQVPLSTPGGIPNYSQQMSFNTPTGSGYPHHSSQIPIVDDDVFVIEKVSKPTARENETKVAWTHDDEILLVRAWYNVSTDSILGNEKRKKDFWEDITAYFNSNKSKESALRSYSQVKNHYYRINPDLNKWTGIYNNFWSNRASGQGDDDVLEAAQKAWRNDDPKNKDFKWLHIWKIIQTGEKWAPQQMPQNPQKKSKNSETDSPSSADTGPRERPMGRQRAKRQAKQKAKMTSQANDDKWKKLNEVLARQMIVVEEQLKVEKEQLKIQHIQLCREDTSHMSEAELNNHNMLVAEIKAKYGWQ